MIRRTHLSLRRIFWFTLGALALVLGGIGVVLPVVPTTPFIILAAFAFGKSAPRFQARLRANRFFGPAIIDWEAQGAIAPRIKAFAIVMMAGSIVLSIALAIPLTVIAVQAVCIACASGYILSRPNGTPRGPTAHRAALAQGPLPAVPVSRDRHLPYTDQRPKDWSSNP